MAQCRKSSTRANGFSVTVAERKVRERYPGSRASAHTTAGACIFRDWSISDVIGYGSTVARAWQGTPPLAFLLPHPRND